MDNFSNCVYNKGVNQKLQKQTIFPYERMKIMKKIIAFALMIAVMLSIAIPAVVNAAPGQVTGIRQTECGTQSIEIEWTGVLGQSVRYYVELSNNGVDGWVDYDYTTSSHKNIYNLAAGTSYYARVKASDDGGKTFGSYSETIEVVTLPEETKGVKQTKATTSSFTIAWDKTLGATGYRVCEYVNGQEYVVATTDKTSYTFKKVSNKESFPYKIYVRPIRKSSTGYVAEKEASYSWSYGGIYANDVMLVPKKLSAPKKSILWYNSKEIVFNVGIGSVPFQKGYETKVYKANSKKVYASGVNKNGYNLNRNQFYKIKSRAYTTIGNQKSNKYGAWSKFTYFTIGLDNVNLKAGKNSIKAYWSKVKGGSVKYNVYISKTQGADLKKVKTVKGTSLTIKKIGKKKLSRKTQYYVYVIPSIKVGKKYIKDIVETHNSVSTL